MAKTIAKFLQRYAVVIIAPTLAVSSIYADWSHTQTWKKQQQLQQQQLSSLSGTSEELAKI